jgi:hypothetical protein
VIPALALPKSALFALFCPGSAHVSPQIFIDFHEFPWHP